MGNDCVFSRPCCDEDKYNSGGYKYMYEVSQTKLAKANEEIKSLHAQLDAIRAVLNIK